MNGNISNNNNCCTLVYDHIYIFIGLIVILLGLERDVVYRFRKLSVARPTP